MANESDENKPSEERATPSGMVEAVTQDVELIVDKVMDTAGDAVIIVQEKLGMRPLSSRAKKPAKPKVKAKAPAAKAKAPAPKMKARAANAKVSKAVKAKLRKVAKSAKSAKPKRAAKSARAAKGRKSAKRR